MDHAIASRLPKPGKVKVCHWTEGQPKIGGGGKWVIIEISQSAWYKAHSNRHADSTGEHKDCRCIDEDEEEGCYCNLDRDECTGICFKVNCSNENDDCNIGICDRLTGACRKEATNETALCSDGDLCLEDNFCTNGECGGGTAVDCSQLDDVCAEGICLPTDGSCILQLKEEGSPCGIKGTCNSGICKEVSIAFDMYSLAIAVLSPAADLFIIYMHHK